MMKRRRLTISTGNNLTLEEGLRLCIDEKRMLNLAPKTLSDYEKFFNYFLDFVGKDTICSEVNEDLYLSYVKYLSEKKPEISKITIKTYLTHVRVVLYFLMDKGYITSFPCDMIKAPKPLKQTYSNDVIERITEKPDFNKCTFCDVRNWALCCYALSTGNRAETIGNIKIGDLDFFNNEIRILTTKNKKQYIFPMSSALKKVLIQYLQIRGSNNPDDFLFCNVYGEKLGYSGIDTGLERYFNQHGVKYGGIHKLRHTFATDFLRNGGSPEILQHLLGHATRDMTMEYVHLTKTDAKKNFDTYNPLDNILKGKKGNFIKNPLKAK